MNLKRNKHKTISFNTATKTSLGFKAQVRSPHLFWSEMFRSHPKIRGAATMRVLFHYEKVKKGIPNLRSPYIHSLYTVVLIKQMFGKNK